MENDNSKSYIGMCRKAKADTIFPVVKTNSTGYEYIIYPCGASDLSEYREGFPQNISIKKLDYLGDVVTREYRQDLNTTEQNKLLQCLLENYPEDMRTGESITETAIRLLRSNKK